MLLLNARPAMAGPHRAPESFYGGCLRVVASAIHAGAPIAAAPMHDGAIEQATTIRTAITAHTNGLVSLVPVSFWHWLNVHGVQSRAARLDITVKVHVAVGALRKRVTMRVWGRPGTNHGVDPSPSSRSRCEGPSTHQPRLRQPHAIDRDTRCVRMRLDDIPAIWLCLVLLRSYIRLDAVHGGIR